MQENDRETARHLRFHVEDCFLFVSLSHEAKELGRILLCIGEVKSKVKQAPNQRGVVSVEMEGPGGFGYFVNSKV